MRGHYTDNATYARIQTRSDDPQDNVFAREDTGDLGVGMIDTWRMFHDTNSSDTTLLHQSGHLTDSRFWGDSCRLRPRVHDSREIWQCGFLAESVDISKHSSGLWVRSHSWAKLGLHARKSSVEFLGCRRGTFDLVQCFMKDLGDVKQSNDIAFLITNRLAFVSIFAHVLIIE
jgi:hypothetical protein